MQTAAEVYPARGISTSYRWLSEAEFIAGAGIVIAHNAYRVLLNEVPIWSGADFISSPLRRLETARPWQTGLVAEQMCFSRLLPPPSEF